MRDVNYFLNKLKVRSKEIERTLGKGEAYVEPIKHSVPLYNLYAVEGNHRQLIAINLEYLDALVLDKLAKKKNKERITEIIHV